MVLESLGLAGGVAEECEEDTEGGEGARMLLLFWMKIWFSWGCYT